MLEIFLLPRIVPWSLMTIYDDSIGRALASYTTGPWFEFEHGQSEKRNCV